MITNLCTNVFVLDVLTCKSAHSLPFPGNFTQLVWKSTKYLGIGSARSRAGKIMVVGNYEPAGNIIGCFKENVIPPIANRDFL